MGDLLPGKFGGNQVLPDSIGINTVIDLCKIAPDIPAELFVLRILKPLKFLDKIEFEFNRDPGREFIRDIRLSIRASIQSWFRDETRGRCLLYPLPGR